MRILSSVPCRQAFWTFWSVPFAICVGVANAQAQEPTEASFSQVRDAGNALDESGAAETERADLFATWMDTNNWQTLSISDQFDLHEGLSADTLERRQMSVRWTGFLTAQTTDTYTIAQIQQYSDAGESVIKVWLGGELVLDSTPRDVVSDLFQSSPISLTANEPVQLRVEMTHNVQHEPYYSDGVPMTALTWEAASIPRQLIPENVYSPPAGFGDGATHGLKGEYFAGSNFGELKRTRLDRGIDFVWAWRPVCGEHPQKQTAIVEACRDKMLDDLFLTGLDNEAARRSFLDSPGWRFCHYLPLSDRKRYVEKLTQHPDLLSAMNAYNMGKLMETVYMLPGKEHLELLQAWCESKPQPRFEIGVFPGSGEGFYESNNTEFYWLIGNFLQGPYWEDLATLWEDELRREDGECNLRLAYTTAYAVNLSNNGESFRKRLRAIADEDGLSGDQKMTWLLAQAFAAETMVSTAPRPVRALPFLEEAMLSAASPGYRFWALQERVARLAAIDQGEQAKGLIEQQGNEFTTPEQQAAIAQWQQRIDEVSTEYETRRSQPDDRQQVVYLEELQRRLAKAQERGDAARVVRYQALIDDLDDQVSQEP